MNSNCYYSETVFMPENASADVSIKNEESKEKWGHVKGLALYMVSPEDTTGENARMHKKLYNLPVSPDYAGMVKTVFWIAVSVLLPVALLQF